MSRIADWRTCACGHLGVSHVTNGPCAAFASCSCEGMTPVEGAGDCACGHPTRGHLVGGLCRLCECRATWLCDGCMRTVTRDQIADMCDGEHVLCSSCLRRNQGGAA